MTRIEILGAGTIHSFRLSVRPIWWPHLALIAFILCAWIYGFLLRVWGWLV